MNYQIEKVLQIDSPEQFYKILSSENWLEETVENFLKSYYRWKFGCPCDSQENWKIVLIEYKKLGDLELTELSRKIGCDKIKLRYDNN